MSESASGEADSSSTASDKDFSCPTCDRTDFASEQGMKIHHSKIHGESLANTVNCDQCGIEFERCQAVANENDYNFCSNSCRGNWLSDHNTGENSHCWTGYTSSTCKNCSKKFEHRPYIERTFCGIDCRDNYEHGAESNFWEGGKVTLECIECGGEFEVHQSRADRRKRCSEECLQNTIALECEWCGDDFEVSKSRKDSARCCSSSCWGKLRATFPTEEQPNYRGGVTEYDYGPNWRPQRRKARKRDHYQCQICGKDERDLGSIPHMHHIIKIRYYREKYDAPEWYERGNRLENLIMLCEEHHKEWEGIPLIPQVD